jgi:catechol 2,3-dioxygenase-like lactoylglutathione lyase family enzyme
MKQSIVHIALVVNDYDEAIKFYTDKLNFTLIEERGGALHARTQSARSRLADRHPRQRRRGD